MLHLRLIILSVGGNISVDSETLLVTDFVNLKIKSVQSFVGAHKGRVCVCVHRDEYSYVYNYLHLYCVSKKIELNFQKCSEFTWYHYHLVDIQ
jgi:hypothetical protein